MNDSDVSKQVQQMVQFIRQEAEEKANEISVSAEEEFNIEKLQIVEAEKRKIRQEYERKEKQLEIKKKINYSMQLNASRLKVLQAQDDLVSGMRESAVKQLGTVTTSPSYKQLLKNLILQGLLRLKEPSVILRCRESDLELVNEILQEAKNEYLERTAADYLDIQLDERKYLPPGQGTNGAGQFCSGGVVLASKDGRIVCENTLDARLNVVFKQKLPEIRQRLFGEIGA